MTVMMGGPHLNQNHLAMLRFTFYLNLNFISDLIRCTGPPSSPPNMATLNKSPHPAFHHVLVFLTDPL